MVSMMMSRPFALMASTMVSRQDGRIVSMIVGGKHDSNHDGEQAIWFYG